MLEEFVWFDDGRLHTHADIAAGETTTYSWDGQRLTQARIESDTDGIVTVDYAYDQNNDLIRRTVSRDGATLSDTRYLVDRQNPTGYSQVLAEIDAATGKLLRTNTWGSQLRSQSEANSSAVRYMKTDALGSTRLVTGLDESAQPIDTPINYTAFGTPLGDFPQTITHAFTGQVRDPVSTLQYHRARWLSTERGQWVSHDPLLDWPAGRACAYGYGSQSPVTASDPLGSASLLSQSIALTIVSILMWMMIGTVRDTFHGVLASSYWADSPEDVALVADAIDFINRAELVDTMAPGALAGAAVLSSIGKTTTRYGAKAGRRAVLDLSEKKLTRTLVLDSAETAAYKRMSKKLAGSGYSAHHLNQHAAFKRLIRDRGDGMCVALRGTIPSKGQHYKLHWYMENKFWDKYRKGGKLYGKTPTCEEYGRALEGALEYVGKHTDDEVKALSAVAHLERRDAGLYWYDPVPDIPDRVPGIKKTK